MRNISHRKLRFGLTLLGITIGIMAIVSLIAISGGLENSINEQMAQFSQDDIYVMPKSVTITDIGQAATLTKDDASAMEKLGLFEEVMPMLMSFGAVEYRRETRNIQILGMEPEDIEEYLSQGGLDVQAGRMLKNGDSNSIVIGSRIADSMFSKKISVQNRIEINGVSFVVVGIMEPIGNPPDDESAYIPLSTMRDVFNKTTELNMILLRPKAGQDPDMLVGRIKRALERERGDENFDVMTSVQLIEQISSLLGVVQIVLVGIAAISLVVGGIGIMNSMYTSVLERTKEIGLMKAVGARNKDIMFFFILEAGLVGAIGGMAGTLMGSLIAIGVDVAAKAAGYNILSIVITPQLVLFGIGFAAMTGAISGAFPAKEASKMQPTDALRQYV